MPMSASAEGTVQPKYPFGFDCSAVAAGSQRQACNRSHLDPPMGSIEPPKRVQPDGLARAAVDLLSEEADVTVPPDLVSCVKLLERVIEQHPELLERPHRLDSCAWVGARLAELLPLPLATKQALLEIDDPRARLARLQSVLAAPS